MTIPPFLRATLGPLRLMLQDRLAVAGLVVLSLIVAMAVFAPLIATHDPRLVNESEDGSILLRAEGRWDLQPSLGETALNGGDAAGGGAIIVGREGAVWTRQGSQWSRAEPAGEVDLNAVAANGAGDWLIVGEAGTILLGDGQEWGEVSTPEAASLTSVAWIDGQEALIVGTGEVIWRLDAERGTVEVVESPVGRGFTLHAVARDVDGTMLVVGERGLAIRYDPADGSAELERIGSSRDLNDLHIDASGVALAVGERGTLLRRAGPSEQWVADAAPDTRALRGGWIGADGRGVAVGRNGIIMELEGEDWRLVPAESERHLRGVLIEDGAWLALGSDRFVSRLLPPSREHLFGTDHLGRDLFSQNVHGARIALLVGFIGAALVVLIGTNIGLVAGYFRGKVESFLMRAVDVMYGIPFEPFALILVLLFRPSLLIVILAVSLLSWRTVARLIRSQVLSLRERPFVKAARIAGASDLRIMYLHIFPNVMPLVFLELAIAVGVAIIAEATLSFLGLGPPQSISWGGILHDARTSGAWRTAWWWNLPPGLFIMTTVLSVFFISRSLEVVANPRLRARA